MTQESFIPHFFNILQTYIPYFLSGLVVSLQLAAWGILLGFVLGLVLALGKVYGRVPISEMIAGYVDVIRGIPLLIILFVVFLGVSKLINLHPFTCAVLSITIKSSAYQSMALTGAIQSVSSGQMLAAEALGFTKLGAIWNVMLPQALRFALPAWSNEALSTVKDTSLAYAIGVTELMRRSDYLAVGTLQPLLAYGGAAVLYYITCTALAKTLIVIELKTRIPGFGKK